MSNYYDYVIADYEDNNGRSLRSLFIAPRWTHFEEGQEAITESGYKVRVVDSLTLRDDELDEISFICACFGRKVGELNKLVAKICIKELDYSDYEEAKDGEG